MKKILLFISAIIIPVFTLAGCKTPIQNTKPSDNVVQIANPASVNCTQKGGTLEMRNNEAGQYGVCKFSDGSECEEWAFFRGECKPGDSNKSDGKTDDIKTENPSGTPADTACDDIYKPVCALVQVQCIKAPCPPLFETIGNECEAKKRGNMVLGMTEGNCEKDLSTTCKTADDCALPPEYAMISRCPMAAKCVAGSCVVVCPLF